MKVCSVCSELREYCQMLDWEANWCSTQPNDGWWHLHARSISHERCCWYRDRQTFRNQWRDTYIYRKHPNLTLSTFLHGFHYLGIPYRPILTSAIRNVSYIVLVRTRYVSCRTIGYANGFQLPSYGFFPFRWSVYTTLPFTRAYYALLILRAPWCVRFHPLSKKLEPIQSIST